MYIIIQIKESPKIMFNSGFVNKFLNLQAK